MVHSLLLLRGGDKSVPEGEDHMKESSITPSVLVWILGLSVPFGVAVWNLAIEYNAFVNRIDRLEGRIVTLEGRIVTLEETAPLENRDLKRGTSKFDDCVIEIMNIAKEDQEEEDEPTLDSRAIRDLNKCMKNL